MSKTITVTMTKKQIIEAIEVETNLSPENWVDLRPDVYQKLDKKNCGVCVVGAVLWGAGVPLMKIAEVANNLTSSDKYGDVSITAYPSDPREDVKASPFAALSGVFEHTLHEQFDDSGTLEESIEEAREASIQFVKDYFPKRIKFSYNGEAVWIEK